MYSVVIPSLFETDGEYLELCVESLRASGFDGQIIVVTNGTKNKPDLKHIKGISTHIHSPAQGQCRAVNIGAQLVAPTSEYIMVSNSDMYYAPGWDKYISKPDDWVRLDKMHCTVFSPNLVEPTDNPGSAPPFLKFNGGLNLDSFKREEVDKFIKEKIAEGKDVAYDYSYDPGFNLPFFIKADFWRFIGGYDTAYDPWGSNSDTDLQTRINLAGVTPRRLGSDVLVYHFSNKTPTFAPENDAFRTNNLDYLKSKFGFDRDDVDGKGLKSDVWYNKDMIPEDKERIKYVQKTYIP